MKKRTICISTFYGSENYGSNLQAIGLSETFKSLGYDVCFLSSFRNLSFVLHHPGLLYARVLNKINRKKYLAFFVPEPYELSPEREKRLSGFRDEHFRTVDFKDLKDWIEAINNRMIFVAGSDIIWNPAKGYPSNFFLDFAYYAKLPRFSYASSVGARELPKKYYRAYRRYLGSMTEVAVREQSVADELERILGRKVNKVVDPSMLLDREAWDKFAKKAVLPFNPETSRYVLCYFVMNDSRYWEYVESIARETGMEIVVLPMHQKDENKPYTIITDGTPYEFVQLIKYASFVCTDSFHASVISMIYGIDFYLLKRKREAEKAKYTDLLTHYHLTDRVVESEGEFIPKPTTDYSYAESQMCSDRERALALIRQTLEKCG